MGLLDSPISTVIGEMKSSFVGTYAFLMMTSYILLFLGMAYVSYLCYKLLRKLEAKIMHG